MKRELEKKAIETTHIIPVYLDDDIFKKLKAYKVETHLSMSGILRYALIKFFEQGVTPHE